MDHPDFSEQTWTRLSREQNERKAAEVEALRVAVASAPTPLPDELLQALVCQPQAEAESILRTHPGRDLWQRRQSHTVALEVFEVSIGDLLKTISEFEKLAIADDSDLFNRQGRETLDRFVKRIQKEFFCCANAAHSLVDHTRHLTAAAKIDDVDYRRTIFETDGLHSLIINLRVLLHKLYVINAGWQRSNSFAAGKSASFMLSKQTLMHAIDDNPNLSRKAETRAYVATQNSLLNLALLFNEYAGRVARYHAWLQGELASPRFVALHDYERCLTERRKFVSLTQWRAMLGNWLDWNAPPNPHHHLHRFLRPEELRQVRRLPRNSHAQADLVVDFLDEHGAATDDFRAGVYRLFERSPRYSWQDAPQWAWRRLSTWFRKYRNLWQR